MTCFVSCHFTAWKGIAWQHHIHKTSPYGVYITQQHQGNQGGPNLFATLVSPRHRFQAKPWAQWTGKATWLPNNDALWVSSQSRWIKIVHIHDPHHFIQLDLSRISTMRSIEDTLKNCSHLCTIGNTSVVVPWDAEAKSVVTLWRGECCLVVLSSFWTRQQVAQHERSLIWIHGETVYWQIDWTAEHDSHTSDMETNSLVY